MLTRSLGNDAEKSKEIDVGGEFNLVMEAIIRNIGIEMTSK